MPPKNVLYSRTAELLAKSTNKVADDGNQEKVAEEPKKNGPGNSIKTGGQKGGETQQKSVSPLKNGGPLTGAKPAPLNGGLMNAVKRAATLDTRTTSRRINDVVSALKSNPAKTVAGTYSSSQASAAVTQAATSTQASDTPPDGDSPNSLSSRSPSAEKVSPNGSRPTSGSLRPDPSGAALQQETYKVFNHLGEGDDDEEPEWDEMLVSVMGKEESYGFSPVQKRSRGAATLMPVDEALSHDVGDESQHGPVPEPSALEANKIAGTDSANYESTQPEDPSSPLERFIRAIIALVDRLWVRFVGKPLSRDKEKLLVSILITPVKRLERDAIRSAKRVHFKLRRKTTTQVFQPLERSSPAVQNWFMFMVLPLVFDIFSFGLRLAFCDVYQRLFLIVYYMDIVCDFIMIADMVVSLVTIVPKGTYKGQLCAATNFAQIARLYFRHQFLLNVVPIIMYQVVSVILLCLPQNEAFSQHYLIYRWIWWISSTPRFVFSLRRLFRYSSESVVDPKITRNVKVFQFVKLVIYILAFAHLIGCGYYFLARLENFGETTWIYGIDEGSGLAAVGGLLYYEHDVTDMAGEYLLAIFWGFCRVSALVMDPGVPGNIPEILASIVVQGVSVYITSLILGTLLTFLVRRDPMEVAHGEVIEALHNYMVAKNVPEDLYETIMRYCHFQYNKTRNSDSISGNDLVGALSRSLQVEVANACHKSLINRCSKIGRPLHKCSEAFLNAMVIKLYTLYVMPGDHVVHKDEIPRELYFVSAGAVQTVDEHDQVVSVIRSDVPDTAPIVGEVPFFLGINYLKAMKASLERDVQLEVLSKTDMAELSAEYPDDCNMICANLWAQFAHGQKDKDGKRESKEDDDENMDKEKLLTKKRILESKNFRKEQQFNLLSKAAKGGELDIVLMLARQGADVNGVDYDGRTPLHMACTAGRYKIVECLLKLGANENMKDRWGQTPLAIAILSRQQMIITVLAGAKAKLDMASPELALCSAAGSGDLAQVKRLVEFGVAPNIGDYDKRTALHVSAAEGHEKIVEFLLLAQADPNCKDRWNGSPLQDALSGGHIGTAHILKAKGAAVTDEFGATAVCAAAGTGDVPKLRMLHSFGQSLDVGDYDDRYPLHLACAEGRVLAVSFLLGISADPNIKDRWAGTAMDDAVRGGTLYHKYCAKLLQGWGGELGNFKNTKEGQAFLNELDQISIQSIRGVIRKLIDQGLDKEHRERMTNQQLLVVMSATVRHMPLVTQLHTNTAVITKEIKHFRTVVHTFVAQIRENLETVLSTLLKGTRRVPEFEISIMDDVKHPPMRPRTARLARPRSRGEIHREIDQFSGIRQHENSRNTDSLFLDAPYYSYGVVGLPRRTLQRRSRMKHALKEESDNSVLSRSQSPSSRRPSLRFDESAHGDGVSARMPANSTNLDMLQGQTGNFKALMNSTSADMIKRNNQRTDALTKTLYDSTVPPVLIRECFTLLKKSDKKQFQWMTEATEGFLDSDEEASLHAETDSIQSTMEKLEHHNEDWWEKHGAKLFNQMAMSLSQNERAMQLLHRIFSSWRPLGLLPEADPMLGTNEVARGLVVLGASSRSLDLDACVDEVHQHLKAFRLLMTPKERRENKDDISGNLRFSNLVSASSTFRNAILNMDVDRTLCSLLKSRCAQLFGEKHCRHLLFNARREKKSANELLHDDNNRAEHKYLTVIISGDILVIRTLDEDEIGRGKCTVGCFFGSWKALNQPEEIPEDEKETTIKEGGTGINNCIIKADTDCEIIKIPVGNLRAVLSSCRPHVVPLFESKLVEQIVEDPTNLEKLNAIILESGEYSGKTDDDGLEAQVQCMQPMSKRKYFKSVPELERQEIQDSFLSIKNLWKHVSRGANSVPKGHFDMVQAFLGESGQAAFTSVFAPMEEPTAPPSFTEECFWHCWMQFLLRAVAHPNEMEERDDDEREDELDVTRKGAENLLQGMISMTLKGASKLQPMDTFTGKADPYLVVTVEGITQKTSIKNGTLEPVWNEKMQFNCFANKSICRLEVFDSEAMGQDRTMGATSFMISANPLKTNFNYRLVGVMADGRIATGSVTLAVQFVKGGRAIRNSEQKTEFQLFCETENYYDWIMFWIMPSRRIEHHFFRVPLQVHEREFTKAVGTLALPLTGLAIKQYLTYLLVEHSHQVDLYRCREFCRFFKRKLDDETTIMYRDIVKIVKERSSGVDKKELFIGTALNPCHWSLWSWDWLVRIVSLYHFLMVPVRISFQSEIYTFTDQFPLSTDLPADLIIITHVLLSLHISYKNSKSQWVTSRMRIFKNTDWIAVFASIPLDWIVYWSGLDPESAVWCRVNKMMLYLSRISPSKFLYTSSGRSLGDLLLKFFFILHIFAAGHYYIGRKVPEWDLGAMNTISWYKADPALIAETGLSTFDRDTYHLSMSPTASHLERYLLCFYLVLSTVTIQGTLGNLVAQNYVEMIYVIMLLLVNLTIYRWISAELSDIVMSGDNKVIRTREQQDKIFQFISCRAFTPDLRTRIQDHFFAVRGNVSTEQQSLLKTLSHGLRVELARLIWRDFIMKVHLFRGCSGQFLDALCVLLQETHYGPEEMVGHAGTVSDHLVILVKGGLETYSREDERIKKVGRKGHVVGALSFFFHVRQYLNTRAARTGAVCICITRDGMNEVLQIYPKDEERVKKNALAFYSKDKQSEGSVAFSLSSSETGEHDDDSDDSDKSNMSRGTSKSKESKMSAGSKSSRKSGASGASSGSQTSSKKKKSKGQKGKNVNAVEGQTENAAAQNDLKAGGDDNSSTLSGGASSLDAGDDDKVAGQARVDDEESTLLKETEHIPMIKERLIEQKVTALLTASWHGDVASVQSLLASDDLTVASKDSAGRTALHIACSEGHAELVDYLLVAKADPTVKDKQHNTPFNDAVRAKHDNVVKIIRKHDPNIQFKLGGNDLGVLMCQAAFDGRLEDLKRYVNTGVDPNESDYDGRTALHLAASEGNMQILEYLVNIKANIMCRDRFNGTPLEDAVRHHFDMPNADAVQRLLRDHGATLAGEGLDYVVKMCSYAADGRVEHIRLLAMNGVDVSLGDYDDRTPLHLAACNGHTAVLEYLLKQDTVLVNACDRFGGTPYQDALRHGRKGAAALLEEAGCVQGAMDKNSKEVIKSMIEQSNAKKEKREKAEREPKIKHVLDNSQESKMVATISDKLSKEIADQSAQIELISQRLIWALRGFCDRLLNNSCNIPFTDKTFVKVSEHVLRLVSEMRTSVNNSRSTLMAEMQGDESAADCRIWRNASKEYKTQAKELDNQMRELILLAKVTKRMVKAVIKVCKRGGRQILYETGGSHMAALMHSTLLDAQKLADDEVQRTQNLDRSGNQSQFQKSKKKWTGIRTTVKVFGGFGGRTPSLSNSLPQAIFIQHDKPKEILQRSTSFLQTKTKAAAPDQSLP